MRPHAGKSIFDRPGAALVLLLCICLATLVSLNYTVPALVAADWKQVLVLVLAYAGLFLAGKELIKKTNF